MLVEYVEESGRRDGGNGLILWIKQMKPRKPFGQKPVQLMLFGG